MNWTILLYSDSGGVDEIGAEYSSQTYLVKHIMIPMPHAQFIVNHHNVIV